MRAHEHQRPPERANSGADWTTWLILGGRGAGKTRAGAEWVRGVAIAIRRRRIALIGETEHDAREVMVEGVSGLLAVHRHDERPQWIPSRRRLEWKNGAVAQVFSAEDPGELARPAILRRLVRRTRQVAPSRSNFRHAAVRAAPWRAAAAGDHHHAAADRADQETDRRSATALTRAGTRGNAYQSGAGLSRARAGALWRHAAGAAGDRRRDRRGTRRRAVEARALEACRVAKAPALARIVVAVDPPASRAQGRRCLRHRRGRARRETARIYVLADDSVGGLSPQAGR